MVLNYLLKEVLYVSLKEKANLNLQPWKVNVSFDE